MTRKTAHDLVLAAKAETTEISPATLLPLLERNAVRLIDVRETDEFRCGHLPGALSIPRGMLEFKIDSVPGNNHDHPLVVYCKSGGRSALAAQTLQKMGYRAVRSLAGGFDNWVALQLPVDVDQQPSYE